LPETPDLGLLGKSTSEAGVFSLRSLYLDNNLIQNLPTDIFTPLANLEKLNLDGRILNSNSKVRQIEISSNQINYRHNNCCAHKST
jgi:Leucine-rich repeat (LRR) protein